MAKTDKTMLSDEALEAFFVAGRARAPEPGAELMARIMADADAEIAARTPARPVRRGRPGRWAAFIGGIGGWPALASLATAAVAGVWLGIASPDQINALAGGLVLPGDSSNASSYELEDLLPGYGDFTALAEEVQG